MSKRRMIVVGMIVSVALALVGVVAVGAQGPDTGTPTPGFGPERGPGGHGFGMRGHFGRPGNSLIAVAAEQLDLTTEELIAELQTDKSIADVAAEKGVAVDAIVDAVIDAQAERLAAAVEAGRLTQEQVDNMLEKMRTNVTERVNSTWSPKGHFPGKSLVDENGDGVCDYQDAGNARPFRGRHGHWGQ